MMPSTVASYQATWPSHTITTRIETFIMYMITSLVTGRISIGIGWNRYTVYLELTQTLACPNHKVLYLHVQIPKKKSTFCFYRSTWKAIFHIFTSIGRTFKFARSVQQSSSDMLTTNSISFFYLHYYCCPAYTYLNIHYVLFNLWICVRGNHSFFNMNTRFLIFIL